MDPLICVWNNRRCGVPLTDGIVKAGSGGDNIRLTKIMLISGSFIQTVNTTSEATNEGFWFFIGQQCSQDYINGSLISKYETWLRDQNQNQPHYLKKSRALPIVLFPSLHGTTIGWPLHCKSPLVDPQNTDNLLLPTPHSVDAVWTHTHFSLTVKEVA